MREAKDIFSKQAITYKKYRPTYPTELYQDILGHVKDRTQCWDCGTGNGQVALELSKHFKQVQASDISGQQISNATQMENINYTISRAEETKFADDQFDLVTVGQAAHWFDFNAFNQEVKRVTKQGGVIAIWGYGLLRIDPSINKLIDDWYADVIGPYWDPERKHIDNEYRSIKFDFQEININKRRSINVEWKLTELQGYFNSWSSVQHYKNQNDGKNPVDELMGLINEVWKQGDQKDVMFPIFLRLGRI